MHASTLIPAAVRARLSGLRLVAHKAAASGGLGQHPSRNRGSGMEFSQYRAYEPGDEPRRIDWKLYARSDRYFVRESERDSALTVWLVLDATASMTQSDLAHPAYSKLDAAKSLAACVLELATRQSDRCGVVAVSAGGLQLVPAATGPRHRDRCLIELQRIQAQGSWPADALVRPLWERVQPSTLVLLLSDFFDEAPVALAERLAKARREVLTVQIIGVDERDFPFRGGRVFRDPESGAQLRTDSEAARTDFIARFSVARQQLGHRLAASGIRHVGYELDQPLDRPLRQFFATRDARSANT